MRRSVLTSAFILFVIKCTIAQNVGIGTTSPAAQLHVKYALANSTSSVPVLILDNPSGGTQTSLQFQVNGVETGRIRSDVSNNMIYSTVSNGSYYFRRNSDGTDLMFISGVSGNVGIGLTNPLAQLHIGNNLAIDNDNNNGGDLTAGALTFGLGISGEGIASKRSSGGNQYGLDFYTNSINRMSITMAGKVGIGTTSPTDELQVAGKIKTTNFQVTNGASNGYVLQSDASGNGVWVNATTLSISETDPQVSSTISNYVSKWNGSTLVDGQIFDNGNTIGLGTSTLATGPNTTTRIEIADDGGSHSDIQQKVANGVPGISWASSNGTIASPTATSSSTFIGLLEGYAYTGSAWGRAADMIYSTDAGVGAGSTPGFILFRTTASGATSTSDRMIIKSNGNVGIGTNSPAQKLDVAGTTKTTNFQLTSGASAGYILQSDGSGNASWVSPAASVVVAGTGLSYSGTTLNSVWTASGNTIYKNNSGNVGIGTTSPSAQLHVKYASANTSADNPALVIDNPIGGTQTTMKFYLDGSEIGRIRADLNGNMYYASGSSGSHYFKGNNDLSDLMVITGTGNVGVGTFFPSARMHITGTTNDILKLESSSTTGTWLNLYNSSLGGSTYSIISSGSGNGEGAGKLLFNGPGGQYMVMDGTGKTGIGTSSPSQKLDVAGTTKTTNFQMTSGAAASTVMTGDASGNGSWQTLSAAGIVSGSGTATRVAFWNGTNSLSANSNLYWDNTNSFLGIGTTSPSYTLHVVTAAGSSQIGMQSNAHAMVNAIADIDNTNGGTINYAFGATETSGSWSRGFTIYDATNSANRFFISPAGNVGIGTISPAQKLDVAGTTKTTSFQMTSGAAASTVMTGDASGNGSWQTLSAAGIVSGSGTATRVAFWNGTNTLSSNTNLYWDNTNGRLGIGVTSPSDELQVVGRIRTVDFQMTNGANNGYLLQANASGQATWVYPGSIISAGTGLSYSGTTLNSVWTASGNDIYKNNSANVGIGTSSPASLLHVSSTSNTTIISEGTTGNAYFIVRAAAGSEAGMRYNTGSTNRWMFGKSNSAESGSDAGSDFFINRYNDAGTFQSQPIVIKRSTGFVGINQGSPAYQLDINGNINMSSALYIGGTKAFYSTGTNMGAGVSAGIVVSSGTGNTFVGKEAGLVTTIGSDNTAVGYLALSSVVSAGSNVAVGSGAGFNALGSGNIFIGAGAGFLEAGSDKLYIDNTGTTTPLIYGDFSTDKLTINGSMDVLGAFGLKAKTAQVAGTNNPDATGGIWFYSSGSGTITLPAASSNTNRVYVILNNTGAGRTISSYQDLSNAPQTSVANNTSLWIVSDGTNWRQIK